MTENRDRNAPRDIVHTAMVEIQRDLLRYLTQRLGSEAEALDVLQDFYVKVLTRIDDVEEVVKLRGWMYRVLQTTLIDHYRARSKKQRSEREYQYLESLRLDGESVSDVDFNVCMCLYKLLPTLKSEYADVLWRADLIGESRTNIARALGITESNLRVRLHRARQMLRQRLEETCRTCPIHGYMDCDCDYGAHMRAPIGQATSKL